MTIDQIARAVSSSSSTLYGYVQVAGRCVPDSGLGWYRGSPRGRHQVAALTDVSRVYR